MTNLIPKIDPGFLYGTAWKEDLTESCVLNAIAAGYRAIDTANQRKHYFEEGVGSALARAKLELGITRDNLFLQTKFTFARGQDHRKPYDVNAPFKDQVQQSFDSSLLNLKTDFLDSYVLHGPSTNSGLTDVDWETWKKMEDICNSGKAKYLGVSNVDHAQLIELYENANVKPTFVQNRCFADTKWDKSVREFCLSKGMIYQGFSLLTANQKFLGGEIERPEGRNIPHLVFSEIASTRGDGLNPEVNAIVKMTGKNIQQIIFRFAQQVGILPITGTRSPSHMKKNLEISDFILSQDQVHTLENVAFLE